MPFKCIDATIGEPIISIDCGPETWQDLKVRSRKLKHLIMPCCGMVASPKTSKLGTQFFAHAKRGDCATAPETPEHLLLKRMAVDAARAAGWHADVEVSGSTEDGREWRADVLATKGKAAVAIEFQWTKQSDDELKDRQARYKDAGIRGLWLIRHPGFPLTKDIPAVCIVQSADQFYACIPDTRYTSKDQKRDPWHRGWHQAFRVEDLLAAAFDRRLSWGTPSGIEADATLIAFEAECWKCHKTTVKVDSVELDADGLRWSLGLDAFDDDEELFHAMFPGQVLSAKGVGLVRKRFSKTTNSTYLSNGCFHCGILQGRYADMFNHDSWDEPEDAIHQRIIVLDERWRKLLSGEPHHWHVSGAAPLLCKPRREQTRRTVA